MYPLSWYGACGELAEGRSGTPLDLSAERQYTRQFLVEVTAAGKAMGPIGVCSHPQLPVAWSYYVTETEFDTAALLVRYDAKPRNTDDWSQWVVTATYSTNTNSGNFQAPTDGSYTPGGLPNSPNNAYSNPEYEWPEIDWNFDEMKKPALVDLDGKMYQNSAGQPYTPTAEYPRYYQVLNISRNEVNFNATVALQYAGAVNDAVFLGHPPGFVQCSPPKAVQRFRGQTRYWRVSYQLKFHPRGIWLSEHVGFDVTNVPIINRNWHELNWQPVMQDQGYMRIENGRDAAGKKFDNFGQPVPIVRNGRPISQQVLLNGVGQEQTVKDPVTGLVIPVYKKYRQFPSKNFTSLISRGFV